MNKVSLKKLVAAVGLILGATVSMQSKAMSCSEIENYYDAYKFLVDYKINQEVAGDVIVNRKHRKVIINSVGGIDVRGCNISSRTYVTVQRGIRRDAAGYLDVSSRVTLMDGRRVCFGSAHVDRVSLSNTTIIGESIYKLIANRALPKNQCINLF